MSGTTRHVSGMSRRGFLSRAGRIGAGGLSLALLGSGCRRTAGDDANTLFIENWPAYLDPTTDDGPGTVDRFMAATGIDLHYSEPINDNEEYFARIQPRLGTGRTIEADLIVVSSWLAARLMHLGWADPLPTDQVPHLVNLDETFRNPSWDPTGTYALPWQAGIAGVAYNRAATGRDVGSVNDLFDPAFRGKVGMLTEMRDTIGLILLGLGIDPADVSSFEQAAPAFERLEAAKESGQIRAFTGNDFLDDLSTGNFAVCIGWSGDVTQVSRENPDVHFVVPDEGALLWVDTMVMPKGARHRAAAAAWIDFVYDPVEAARIAASVQGISPVRGVRTEVARMNPELAANPFAFPDQRLASRLTVFADLAEDVELEFDRAFSRIVGA